MTFSNYMKYLRATKKLTQLQISECLDVSTTTIKMIENGSTKFPGQPLLKKISQLTDSSGLDVAYYILFDECPEGDTDFDSYMPQRYMTKLYLDGWNLRKRSVHIDVYSVDQYYEGILSKKRDPRNNIIIKNVEDYGLETHEYDEENAFYIICDILKMVYLNEENLKSVHLLFDARDEGTKDFFDCFTDLYFNKLPIDIFIIIYNPESNKIELDFNILTH